MDMILSLNVDLVKKGALAKTQSSKTLVYGSNLAIFRPRSGQIYRPQKVKQKQKDSAESACTTSRLCVDCQKAYMTCDKR